MKFSEDIIPISDLKINPGKIIKQVQNVHRPILLTNRGRGVAIMQALSDYETENEERDFMKAVVRGLIDIEEGRELSLSDIKRKLKI